jgi:hypothetical protein
MLLGGWHGQAIEGLPLLRKGDFKLVYLFLALLDISDIGNH